MHNNLLHFSFVEHCLIISFQVPVGLEQGCVCVCVCVCMCVCMHTQEHACTGPACAV
jgi:hypothetical protein